MTDGWEKPVIYVMGNQRNDRGLLKVYAANEVHRRVTALVAGRFLRAAR